MISQDPGPQGPGKIKKKEKESYKLQATSYKLQASSATKRTQLKSIINLERNKL